MLLKLTFDHSALHLKFTEYLFCQVPGYQASGAYAKEPWAVLGIAKFIYCSETLTVELAIIEGNRLIIYHDCDRYPFSPVRVLIKSIRSQKSITKHNGDKKDQNSICKLIG